MAELLSGQKSLYDSAMQAAIKRKMDAKRRMNVGLQEVNSWLDLMDSVAPVGNAGGGGGNRSGVYSGGQSAANVRNAMEGRGPSSGAIPPLVQWKWRDPIDSQLFRATTAKGTKKQFKGLLRTLASRGYDVDVLGSYANRNARGSNRLSEHAYGRAIDINPGQNPMGSRLITNMPDDIAAIARAYNLVWGGTWKSKKDAMHFSTSGW